MKRAINAIFLVFSIVLAVAIFYISSLNLTAEATRGLKIMPILYHFGIFFMLSFSLLAGLMPKKILFLALSLAFVIYALSDEIHQYFVLGRACTIFDFAVDSLGILSALIFYSFIILLSQNKNFQIRF